MVSLDVDDIDLNKRQFIVMGKGARERLAPLGYFAAVQLVIICVLAGKNCCENTAAAKEKALWLNKYGKGSTEEYGELLKVR